MPVEMIMMRMESQGASHLDVRQQIVDEERFPGSKPVLPAGDFVNLAPRFRRAGSVAICSAFEVPEERVLAQEIVAMDVVGIAQQVEWELRKQLLDHRDHRLIRLEDVLPRIDERGLGSPVFEHIKHSAQE